MQKTIMLSLLLACAGAAWSQDGDMTKISDSITAKGKKLYRSEMASWYGTDIFVEKFAGLSNRGGYFSYDAPPFARCVFYSNDETPKVLATITFDSTYSTATAQVDGTQRGLTDEETILFTLRKKASALIKEDTLFKSYKNTNLNLIPLIDGDSREVYVLTGAETTGLVIFGNDYLLRFDSNNNLLGRKRIHLSMIPVQYGHSKGTEIGAMHTHLPETGEFITATDICTLMLYEKFAKWEQHMVVGEHWLSIWNCQSNRLIIVPQDSIKKKKKKNN